MSLLGFHHLTAISAQPQATLDFYTGFFRMRLVKRTVNFDDPGTHHFYFGNSTGDPGALLTFFPWLVSRRGRMGPGRAVAVAFQTASLEYWMERAREARVGQSPGDGHFGEPSISLRDAFGMVVNLVEHPGAPQEHLGALHSATLWEADPARLAELLTSVLGFERVSEDAGCQRFQLPGGSARLDVVTHDGERGVIGPSGIHHIALRVAGDAELDDWRARLIAAGQRVTLPQNRRYFRSIYFRPPGGVLFEIATTGAGFTVDEPLATLGERLCLPPWLESERASIEARLPPVTIPANSSEVTIRD